MSMVQISKLVQDRAKYICLCIIVFFATLVKAGEAQVVRKEVMERLFFDQSQREVMESVRQGIVDRSIAVRELQVVETTAIEVPEIVFKTVIKREEVTGQLVREADIHYGGFIRKQAGETKLLLDDILVDQDAQEVLEDSLGMGFALEDSDGQSFIYADDRLFKQRYSLKRGDIVASDGTLTNQDNKEPRFIVVKR